MGATAFQRRRRIMAAMLAEKERLEYEANKEDLTDENQLTDVEQDTAKDEKPKRGRKKKEA